MASDEVEGDEVRCDDVKGDEVEGDEVKCDDVKGDEMEGAGHVDGGGSVGDGDSWSGDAVQLRDAWWEDEPWSRDHVAHLPHLRTLDRPSRLAHPRRPALLPILPAGHSHSSPPLPRISPTISHCCLDSSFHTEPS